MLFDGTTISTPTRLICIRSVVLISLSMVVVVMIDVDGLSTLYSQDHYECFSFCWEYDIHVQQLPSSATLSHDCMRRRRCLKRFKK